MTQFTHSTQFTQFTQFTVFTAFTLLIYESLQYRRIVKNYNLIFDLSGPLSLCKYLSRSYYSVIIWIFRSFYDGMGSIILYFLGIIQDIFSLSRSCPKFPQLQTFSSSGYLYDAQYHTHHHQSSKQIYRYSTLSDLSSSPSCFCKHQKTNSINTNPIFFPVNFLVL